MVLVGSGFCDHGDEAATGPAILGKIVVTLGFKFLNGVHDRRIVVDTGKGVQIVSAVQEENVATVSSAVDGGDVGGPDRFTIPPSASAVVLVSIDIRDT